MPKARVIFTSKENIHGYMPLDKEFVEYTGTLQITDRKNSPVTLELSFVPPPPFIFLMPEEKLIKADSITSVYAKLVKFFKRYGYVLQA